MLLKWINNPPPAIGFFGGTSFIAHRFSAVKFAKCEMHNVIWFCNPVHNFWRGGVEIKEGGYNKRFIDSLVVWFGQTMQREEKGRTYFIEFKRNMAYIFLIVLFWFFSTLSHFTVQRGGGRVGSFVKFLFSFVVTKPPYWVIVYRRTFLTSIHIYI